MKNFYLYQNYVKIVNNDDTISVIYFNENSGKVYYRYKIGSISKVKHPGIFLGIDTFGIGYFLHNHYHFGKAHIIKASEFAKGEQLYLYNDMCSNNRLKVIEIGLNEILRGESYKPISYNCQTYTNTACHNVRKSADAEKWLGGVILAGLTLFVLGAAINIRKEN